MTWPRFLIISCASCGPGSPGQTEKGVIKTAIAEVRLRKGESIDRAIKRLKKKLDKEGVMRQIRMHRHYEKPSERRRRKAARARVRSRSS